MGSASVPTKILFQDSVGLCALPGFVSDSVGLCTQTEFVRIYVSQTVSASVPTQTLSEASQPYIGPTQSSSFYRPILVKGVNEFGAF